MKQHVIDPVREQAAAWFARVQDAPGDGDMLAALGAWLEQDARHREEYQLLVRLWGAADFIPRQRLEALCAAEPVRQLPRRRVLRQALAAGVAIAALGLGWTSVRVAGWFASGAQQRDPGGRGVQPRPPTGATEPG